MSVLAEKSWYVVHTKPRQEQTALLNLERQGYECYLPQLCVEKVRRGKAGVVTEPMFSRYLFIRLDTGNGGKSWSPIRSTLGVCQLVSFGGRPAKAPNELVETLHAYEQQQTTEKLFSPDDNVTIIDGPFAGVEAIYQAEDSESRAMILLEMLSKPVSMTVELAGLRRIAGC